MSTLSDAASKALNCSQTMEPRLVRAFSLFPAWNLLQWNSPRPGRHLVLGSDAGPIPYPGPGSCGTLRIFWSNFVRCAVWSAKLPSLQASPQSSPGFSNTRSDDGPAMELRPTAARLFHSTIAVRPAPVIRRYATLSLDVSLHSRQASVYQPLQHFE
jgi:hypothetical protein